jgi:hypothetical protein
LKLDSTVVAVLRIVNVLWTTIVDLSPLLYTRPTWLLVEKQQVALTLAPVALWLSALVVEELP